MQSFDIDNLKWKAICIQCIGEAFLSEEIERVGVVARCSYCSKRDEKSITIEDLAARIALAFENHYTRMEDQPNGWQQSILSDRESNYEWEPEGLPVVEAIEDAAEIPHQAAADVQMILGDQFYDRDAVMIGEVTEFSSETYYEGIGVSTLAWQAEWQTFERSLKTEARFFSSKGAAHLSAIFGRIDAVKTTNGRDLVIEVGPQFPIDHIYRARVFQSNEILKEALCYPDKHLGSPPAHLASAGRMNAQGISVFYGSTEKATAIAEVRPPIGSNVATAMFSIARPLRLLDLTALELVHVSGSIFDPTLKSRLEHASFMQTLTKRMMQPVMPDDEAFDYLPTQAIADFLATENKPRFDGIIFPSVQVKDGRNVVLFHKSACVKAINTPVGTMISASSGYDTEDGPEIDYTVTEEIPSLMTSEPKNDKAFALDTSLDFIPFPHSRDDAFRVDTLCIDPQSVVVHHVDWVHYNCTPYKVSRNRLGKTNSDF